MMTAGLVTGDTLCDNPPNPESCYSLQEQLRESERLKLLLGLEILCHYNREVHYARYWLHGVEKCLDGCRCIVLSAQYLVEHNMISIMKVE